MIRRINSHKSCSVSDEAQEVRRSSVIQRDESIVPWTDVDGMESVGILMG